MIVAFVVLGFPVVSFGQTLQNPDSAFGPNQCYGAGSNVLGSCAATTLVNQDAQVGRDADAGTNGNADGKLGFSFTKVCNSGEHAGVGTCPADPALGPNPNDWACTFDNVTGETWEVKTLSGARSAMNLYTNYTKTYDPLGQFGSATDVSGFIALVNSTALCGATDWIMDHATIRQSLTAYGSKTAGVAMIDATFFPTMQAGTYWTQSPHPSDASHAWTISYGDGTISDADARDVPHFVQAVRRRPAGYQPDPRWTQSPDGSELTDHFPGAYGVWRRCSEGQTWNGSSCLGTVLHLTHEQALVYAAQVAASTGTAWRLPTIKELTAIVERDNNNPAIQSPPWSNTPSEPYWASTPNPLNSKTSWVVDFHFGVAATAPRSQLFAIRLIHSN